MAGPKERGTKIPRPVAKIFAGLHRRLYTLSGGRIGSKVSDGQIVLLHTTGAKTGKTRSSPLIALDYRDGWAVVASFSGHDVHPGWFHNLQAHSEASVTVGATTTAVTARTVGPHERGEMWDRAVVAYGDYEMYARVTDREIPIVALEPIG